MAYTCTRKWKINKNGSRDPNNRNIVSGLLRDKHGNWIRGFGCNLGKGTVLEAERWGIFHGYDLALEFAMREGEIETESFEALNLILYGNSRHYPLAGLISDYRSKVNHYSSIKLIHTHKEENVLTDHLTKMSSTRDFGLKLLDQPPISLFPFLNMDRADISKAHVDNM